MNIFWLFIPVVFLFAFKGLGGSDVPDSDDAGDGGGDDSGDDSPDPDTGNPWSRFDDLFHSFGETYGVDWTWLKAICMNESSLGSAPSVARGLASPSDIEGSKSTDGKSWGIMQVTIKTARGLDPAATEVKLNDPNYSVKLAAMLVAQLQKQFSRVDPRYTEWVIKSYNQGAGNTKKEIAGVVDGYAQEYWNRFQRNLTKVEENPV